jgi:hypothetical protein
MFAQLLGSRLGAGDRWQVVSEAVTEAEATPLTRAFTGELHPWHRAHSVVVLDVGGSSPLAHPERSSRPAPLDRVFRATASA